MPKINFLNLLLWSNLVLLILSSESVIYDGKTIEEMKSSLWNSNSEGFYYLDFHPIRDGETIIALTSIEKDEQSKGYTDIITYKEVDENEHKYNFYLYKYNKEKLNFEEPKPEEDPLFSIQNKDIESVRNLYVGKFSGDIKGYLVSFNNKDNETLIHYLAYDDKKISLTEKYKIKSNIIILNRNAKNQSQIFYQDENKKFQICVLNDKFECINKPNLKGDEGKGICKMPLQGGVAYVDVDGNCSPDIIIGCEQEKDGIEKRIIRIYTSTRKKDDEYYFAQDLDIGNSDHFGPFIISRIKNERHASIAPQLDILVPLTNTTDKTQVLGLKNTIKKSYDWEKIYCNETDEYTDDTKAERTIFDIDGIYELKDPDNKLKGYDTENNNGIALIRPGDFLSSGLPGLLVREKIDDNGDNKTAISLYEKTDDGFSLYLRVYGGDKLKQPKNGIFFDINESGSLGLIIEDDQGKNHFIYNYRKNAFFVKAKLMNDINNYYDSNVGATFRYIATDSDGDRYMDISYQLAQTSDNNIPLPFSLVGLGDTSNYVEYFEIVSGNHYSDEKLFDDDEYRNFKTQTPIVPNTQMAVFKYINEDSKYEWHLDLFVLPTDSLLIIALVIVVVMLIILGVIIYLHVREVKEEQKETNKFKSWFA